MPQSRIHFPWAQKQIGLPHAARHQDTRPFIYTPVIHSICRMGTQPHRFVIQITIPCEIACFIETGWIRIHATVAPRRRLNYNFSSSTSCCCVAAHRGFEEAGEVRAIKLLFSVFPNGWASEWDINVTFPPCHSWLASRSHAIKLPYGTWARYFP